MPLQHTFAHRQRDTWRSMIMIVILTKDSCTKDCCKKRQCFRGVSTKFWIRPAIWLHSVHEIAVPISRSPSAADEAWYWPKRVLRSGWLCKTSRPVLQERYGLLIVHIYTPGVSNAARWTRFEHNHFIFEYVSASFSLQPSSVLQAIQRSKVTLDGSQHAALQY